MTRFFKFTLRTTDVAAARSFYGRLFGERAAHFDVVPLHEQALARGAKPHWLGFLEVADVDGVAKGFVERGAQPMAKWVNPAGLEAAVLRDAGGAMFALGKPPPALRGQVDPLEVSWHALLTRDVEQAKQRYQALCGWHFLPKVELGPLGVVHPFGWQAGGEPVGVLAAVEERPQAHPHWSFNVTVPSMDEAVAAAKAGGAAVLGPSTLPSGEKVAVCDDPQGATFGLRAVR